MKLYFAPGACSLATHITLRELGMPFELVKVDLRTKTTQTGADFTAINPKGYVPALELDDGTVLTEGTAILQYLADRQPQAGLAPANGTMARYRLQEWLGFINSEIHKLFGPLFSPHTPEQAKQAAVVMIGKRLGYVETALGNREFVMDTGFTVADAYLYTVLSWTNYIGIDLGQWPALKAYLARISARPTVQAAHKAEHAE
ncbi:MAG: glutathione transferase GstA [Steroidobacteraceae bacterium]